MIALCAKILSALRALKEENARKVEKKLIIVKKGGGSFVEDFSTKWYGINCPLVACSHARKLSVSLFGEEK